MAVTLIKHNTEVFVHFRKGHFFKIDLRYEDNSLLTAEELKILLKEIRTVADGNYFSNCIHWRHPVDTLI